MLRKILMRRGSASAWTANNPVLSPGEFGIELDTLLIKVGDGVRAWNSLPYIHESTEVKWVDITGKPTSFPSDWSNISNKPDTFPTTWAQVGGAPIVYTKNESDNRYEYKGTSYTKQESDNKYPLKEALNYQLPNNIHVLPVNTNLNTINTPGFYSVPGGFLQDNFPEDLTGSNCSLLVMLRGQTNTFLTQVLIAHEGDFYTRTYSGNIGSWSPWKIYIDKDYTYSRSYLDGKFAEDIDGGEVV